MKNATKLRITKQQDNPAGATKWALTQLAGSTSHANPGLLFARTGPQLVKAMRPKRRLKRQCGNGYGKRWQTLKKQQLGQQFGIYTSGLRV
jgi:hypothetical protein